MKILNGGELLEGRGGELSKENRNGRNYVTPIKSSIFCKCK
jgi:hypothetical protein